MTEQITLSSLGLFLHLRWLVLKFKCVCSSWHCSGRMLLGALPSVSCFMLLKWHVIEKTSNLSVGFFWGGVVCMHFKNIFIEKQLTYHKIHCNFGEYISVNFTILTDLCNHHSEFQDTSIALKTNSIVTSSPSLSSSSPASLPNPRPPLIVLCLWTCLF